jgi:chorismate dehydratase
VRPARLGAVSYLNTRPLVHGLDERPDLFDLRFDVPAVCATLLHEGGIDVGLIPAIEYLRGDYAVVPDLAIGSDGPIASVAVFTTRPIDTVRSMALDVSSRTSVALTRILCAKRWGIAPRFMAVDPDPASMLRDADAALVIGDLALALDANAYDVVKIDLGTEWQALTGLPFVYAMWAGRDEAVDGEQVAELQRARDRGVADLQAIAHEAGRGDPVVESRALVYLRDNLRYGLGDRELAGLERFHALAVEIGVAPAGRPVRFYS